MTKRTKKADLCDALIKVKECLSLLPDDQERQRITQIIPEIIKELGVLRDSIGRFPDASETHQVSHAIHTLVSFFETLKDRPLLAEIPLPRKAKSRKTKSMAVDVHALQGQLEGLSTEKILEELIKHKKDVLVELATKMNITANKKLTKDALADRIFKLGFANKRGYTSFDDVTWKPAAVSAGFGGGPWGKIAGLGADVQDDPVGRVCRLKRRR